MAGGGATGELVAPCPGQSWPSSSEQTPAQRKRIQGFRAPGMNPENMVEPWRIPRPGSRAPGDWDGKPSVSCFLSELHDCGGHALHLPPSQMLPFSTKVDDDQGPEDCREKLVHCLFP